MNEPVAADPKLSDPIGSIPPPQLARKPARAGGLDPVAIVALIAFVLVGGLLVFGFARTLIPAAEAQLGAACRPLGPEPRNEEAPALELEDMQGNPVALADLQGKFLVVNFWATWCEPCTREWPDLAILGERLSEREDVQVVAISVDQEKSAIMPYLERMGLQDAPVTLLWDRTGKAHQTFGSEKIPDTYFVNEDGVIEAVFVNVRQWGRSQAFRCVEASIDR